MGSLTPKPNIRQTKIKLTSVSERNKLLMLKNVEVPEMKNK